MGPPASGLVEGITNPHCRKPVCYEMLHRASDLKNLVNKVMNLRVP
jgi:hypothetical protein